MRMSYHREPIPRYQVEEVGHDVRALGKKSNRSRQARSGATTSWETVVQRGGEHAENIRNPCQDEVQIRFAVDSPGTTVTTRPM